jgi:cytochrome P450
MAIDMHIPAHVPPARVRDVDLYNLPGATEDVHLAWKRVQDECPAVFYTPRYGGYWVITRAELLEQVWPDHVRFSSDRAIAIPRQPNAPAQLPIEVDPPLHQFFRYPINIALAPRAVQALSERARVLSVEIIERLLPRGECEFVKDFAAHVPMEVFLSIVKLPSGDREWLIRRAEIMTRGGAVAEKEQALQEIFGYLGSVLEQRREAPGDDLISRILQVQVNGRPISQLEALSECALALFGGLDTVAGTMAFFARYLATHDEQRRALARHPERIPAAIEELLRRHSIPTVARVLTQDVVLDGVTLKAGDYVQLTACLHGLDERKWPDSLAVEFDRPGLAEHMAFGRGAHRCPGANLARSELRVFLEEWLKRIPEFRIKPGAIATTATGAVAGVLQLPLVWPVEG